MNTELEFLPFAEFRRALRTKEPQPMQAEVIKPTKPAANVINGLPRTEYDLMPGVNWSRLKWMGKSPAHYRHNLMQPVERTDAMVIGNATHVAVFEPEEYRARFAIWDGGRRAGKEWDAFCAANRGRDILTQAQSTEVQIIANAVRNDPVASKYVTGGRGEVTIRWEHELADGWKTPAKARPDFVASIGALVDLKTTRDGSPVSFGRQVANLDYLGQCAWYADGYEIATGVRLPFWIVAADNKAPHVVQAYRVTEDQIAIGRTRYTSLLTQLAHCLATNRWPGYVDGESDLLLPRYAYPDLDDETASGSDFDFTHMEA